MNAPVSALVARVSLEQQAKNYSLPAQVAMLTDIAHRQGFATDPDFVLIDDGFEGDDWDRPAINRALELVRAGKVRAVAFLDTDRFSRDVKGGLNLIEKIRKAGGQVLFGDLGPYQDDANFALQLNIKLSIAQFEKAKIRVRSRYGTMEKIKQGKPHGGRAPYGFRFVTKAEGGNALVIIPEQTAVVRRIFEWADEGWSLRRIVRRLVADDVPPPRTNWNAATISKLLRDETYAGTWHYNKRQAIEPENRRKPGKVVHRRRSSATWRPESEWIGIKLEPIVDRSLFDRVSAQTARNVNCLSGRPSDRYLLKGLVWCAKCGKRSSGWFTKGVSRYICSNRDRQTGEHLCGALSVRAEALESAVWDGLRETMLDAKRLEALYHERQEDLTQALSQGEIAQLRARMEELKRREFKARRAALDAKGDREVEEFYEAEARETALQRRELLRQMEAATPASVAIDREAIAALRKICRTEDRGRRQQVLQQAVNRVTYHDHEAEIELRVPLASENCQHDQPHVDSFILLKIKRRVA